MNTHKKGFLTILIVLCMIGALSPLSAAGQKAVNATIEPVVSIIDSRNKTISLPYVPQRIVSLSPNITETLFALGLGEKVVGRTDYCDYPPEAASIAAMGDLLSPSIEKILSMEPDLVIIGDIGQAQTVDAIETGGVPIAYINEPGTMDGTYRIIEQVGKITGTDVQAKQLVSKMKKTIAEATAHLPATNRPTVYYVTGFGEWGDFTATGDTYLHDVITLAGGINIASDAVNWSYQVELLLANDPDILILPALWGTTPEETKQNFVSHPPYSSLTAVKNDKIITSVENNIMERQGPRSAEAVAQLAHAFMQLSR